MKIVICIGWIAFDSVMLSLLVLRLILCAGICNEIMT
jgi:hypothetical protein